MKIFAHSRLKRFDTLHNRPIKYFSVHFIYNLARFQFQTRLVFIQIGEYMYVPAPMQILEIGDAMQGIRATKNLLSCFLFHMLILTFS